MDRIVHRGQVPARLHLGDAVAGSDPAGDRKLKIIIHCPNPPWGQ